MVSYNWSNIPKKLLCDEMRDDELTVLTWLTTPGCPLHFSTGWIPFEACALKLSPRSKVPQGYGGLNPGRCQGEGEDKHINRTIYIKVLHEQMISSDPALLRMHSSSPG